MFKILTVFTILATFATSGFAADKIKIMLLTGRSNKFHSWQGNSAAIRQHLEAARLFQVDTVVAPPPGADLSSFSPKWSDYQAVVLDYDGEDWAEPTKTAFADYIRNGGGLVTVHATNNSFAYWPEFLEMTGLGGWGGSDLYDPPLRPGDASRKGGRDERWGPSVHWSDGHAVHDEQSKGGTGHPPRHNFIITTRDFQHPITRGLPEMWLQADDEIYSNMHGPAKNLTVLATALANPAQRNASPRHEPVLFTVAYGKGRVFQTTLGHIGANQDANVPSVQNVGFIVTLQRGTEWAATGKVDQPIPDDFPTAYQLSVRPGPTEGWTALLDPKLSQWEVFLGVPHSSVEGLPAGTYQSAKVTEGEPLGLKPDLKSVFTTKQEKGETILHISGEIYGALSSLKSYENYHLQAKMRWGEKKWAPRLNDKRDSGILYHCQGEHGAFWKVWKSSLEFQVQEADMGDLITLAGPKVQAPFRAEGDRTVYDPKRKFETWSGYLHATVEPDYPTGEWNTLDIYVVGDSSIHVVNGKVVMSLKGAVDKDGQPLTRGQLQIQSEAAEVYYKDIKIRSITAFPEILKIKAKLF